MAEYNFNKDIIVGEQGEKIVIRDLETLGLIFESDNKNNQFDLLMSKDGREITYEVKTDVLVRPEADTANMFIEYECRGKESGIKVTKAEWFVTYFQHLRELWYIKTEDLINIIEENEFKTTEYSGDGDSNTKGYLLPRYQFKNNFIVRRVPREWINNQN